MKHLVPHFILEHYAQGQMNGRFYATTLFVDVSGFTATTNALMQYGKEGAEAMADAMEAIFSPLVRAVYARKGFVTHFAGDAFTAVFPEQPDQARYQLLHQAIAAAAEMQQFMLQQPYCDTTYGRFPFAIKIGVAEGDVYWGILGGSHTDGRVLYYFSGPAIDACSAAEHLAQPQQLIVNNVVYEALSQELSVTAIDDDHWLVTEIQASIPELEDAGRAVLPASLMAEFIPETILRRRTRGEYRQVVSLFLGLDGVRSHRQLDDFVRHVFLLQRQYGGHLNAIRFGDKGCTFLLFWGMPASHENDLDRALNFSLDLRQQSEIPFRAGITNRMMYAGFVGAPGLRQEYTCYGTGVSLAARLMQTATPDNIWIDAELAGQLYSRYTLANAGSHQLRGFEESQTAFVLQNRQETAVPRFQGLLVGRRVELERLQAFLEPLSKVRFAGMLVLSGDAGVGKSRLVSETYINVSDQANDAAPQLLYCPADELSGQPLQPFRHMLHTFFGQSVQETAVRNTQAFTYAHYQLIANTRDNMLRSRLEQARPLLSTLLNIELSSAWTRYFDGPLRTDDMIAAILVFLQAESRRQPIILHIENAQWLDADSIRCLESLADGLTSSPVAILVSGRPHPILSEFQQGATVTKMVLAPLDASYVAAIATQILGEPPAPQLLQLIAKRSGGNPLFVEQILLYLQQHEELQEIEHLDRTGALLSPDIRNLLVARLDSLPRPVLNVVQAAAVLGRAFEISLLAPLLDSDEFSTQIDEAKQANIWQAVDKGRIAFYNDLLRDSAYDMQSQARRQELHLRAAQAIETLYHQDLTPHYDQLIHHFHRAQAQVQERAYLLLAAKRSAKLFEGEVALTALNQALSLTADSDMGGQFEVLRQRESLFHLLGNREQQKLDLDRLQVLAELTDTDEEGLERRVDIAIRRTEWLLAEGDLDSAVTAAEQALTLADSTSSPMLLTKARYLLSIAQSRAGDYTNAHNRLEQALRIAHTENLQSLVQDIYFQLGSVAFYQKKYERALKHYFDALAGYKVAGDRRGQSSVLTNMGNVYRAQQKNEKAAHNYEKALTIQRDSGDRRGEAISMDYLGQLALQQGNYTKATTSFQASWRIRQEVGDETGVGQVLRNLSHAAYTHGYFQEARKYVQLGLHHAQQAGDRLGVCDLLNLYALIQQSLSEYRGAEVSAVQARELSENIDYQPGLASSLMAIGRAREKLDGLAEASAFYKQARELYQSLKRTGPALEALAGEARVQLMRDQIEEAAASVDELLSMLAPYVLDDADEPYRVYLTCYRVLEANEDERAPQFLQSTHRYLMSQAEKLEGIKLQESYLYNVPARNAIITLWEYLQE